MLGRATFVHYGPQFKVFEEILVEREKTLDWMAEDSQFEPVGEFVY
jgi:hypothetical protein